MTQRSNPVSRCADAGPVIAASVLKPRLKPATAAETKDQSAISSSESQPVHAPQGRTARRSVHRLLQP